MPLPVESMEKIVKNAGVEKISPEALKELQKAVDEIGFELAIDSALAARRAGRKTITAEDVFSASGKQKA